MTYGILVLESGWSLHLSGQVHSVLFDMGGTLDGDGAHWFDRFVELYERAGLAGLGHQRLKDAFYYADDRANHDPDMPTLGLLLQWIDSDPVRVWATVSRHAPETLDDEVVVRVEFENGAEGRIMLTWRAEVRRNTIAIDGDRASIRIDGEELAIVVPNRPTLTESAESLSAGSHHTDWFRGLLPDFAAAIAEPARRGEALREAAWCLVLAQAVYELEQSGVPSRRVELPVSLRGSIC